MLQPTDFRALGHELVDWMADYLENIRQYPVKSQCQPGDTARQLPAAAPEQGEDFGALMRDFQDIILPGITHWQHPNFHAYFPANSSVPSLLAEMLTATLGAQCMSWETSPAAAELEERVMEWLRDAMGLPASWLGVIQDTASTATLVALLCARERLTSFASNERGLAANGQRLRVYCSTETHSSIEKDVTIAGIGRENLVKIPVDGQQRMRVDALAKAMAKDVAAGFCPMCVVVATGTTGTTAIDPLRGIAEVAQRYGAWVHVDAAYAGSALLLPDYRWMIDGIELADSFVFNPHKWLFTHFDCTAYFLRDRDTLLRTLSILPEYLKTQQDPYVNNYRDWGVPLGRRFRALKLWFVLRSYGLEGLRERLQAHIDLAIAADQWVEQHPTLERMATRTLNVVFFRDRPAAMDEAALDAHNEALLQRINATGKAYLTHTRVNGAFTLRMVIGQTYVTRDDVQQTQSVVEAAIATTLT